jgi:hypothetical protein
MKTKRDELIASLERRNKKLRKTLDKMNEMNEWVKKELEAINFIVAAIQRTKYGQK